MFERVEKTEGTEGLVHRWLPEDICNIDRMESWLSDMAKEGLFLDTIHAYRASFRRSVPRRTSYRIDVLSRELTADELALYDSCGWHYVTVREESGYFWNATTFYVFQTEENATIPELHTDPMEQAESLRHLAKVSAVNFWGMLLAIVGVFGLTTVSIWLGPVDFWFGLLVYGNGGILLSYLPMELIWLGYGVFAFCSWRSVRRLRKRLSMGEALDHSAPYRKKWRHGIVRMAARWVPAGLALLMIPLVYALTLGKAGNFTSLPLPEGTPDFPVVRLSEVEGREGLTLTDGLCSRERTITGVEKSRIYESARVDEDLTTMETVCYEMPYDWESSHILDWFLSQYTDAVPIETDLLDAVWMEEASASDNRTSLFVRDGRYVLWIQYNRGARALIEAMPLLARRLNG